MAILTKKEPNKVVYGSGIDHMDFEGRILRVDFDEVSVMSLYLPSGTNVDRLDYKFKFMDEFQDYIEKLKKEIPNLVICGDYNICHEAIDIHDPVRNKTVSGFLPEERSWLDLYCTLVATSTIRHDKKNITWHQIIINKFTYDDITIVTFSDLSARHRADVATYFESRLRN